MEILPLGYFKTRFIFRVTGVADSLGFSLAFGPFGDGNQAAAVNGHVANSFESSELWLAAASSPDYTYESIETTQMLDTGPFTAALPIGDQGTGSIAPTPLNFAVLVRKVTNQGGATNRGRIYWPPYQCPEGTVTANGTISVGQTAFFNGLWDDFWTALDTAGLEPVLLHSDPLEMPTPILGFSPQSLGATQRRRMR